MLIRWPCCTKTVISDAASRIGRSHTNTFAIARSVPHVASPGHARLLRKHFLFCQIARAMVCICVSCAVVYLSCSFTWLPSFWQCSGSFIVHSWSRTLDYSCLSWHSEKVVVLPAPFFFAKLGSDDPAGWVWLKLNLHKQHGMLFQDWHCLQAFLFFFSFVPENMRDVCALVSSMGRE